jgi:hypothetical protein
MSMSMSHVLAACPFFMSMLHILAACPGFMSMPHVHTTCPCRMSMLHVHAACPCSMSMPHVHAAYPWSMFRLHARAACFCCMVMLPIVHTACWLSMLHVSGTYPCNILVHASCPYCMSAPHAYVNAAVLAMFPCCMPMSMLHLMSYPISPCPCSPVRSNF